VRIESIELYHVSMPLVYPFRTAFSDEAAIESVFVRMVSGGDAGWGETTPWRAPLYSSEWAGGAFLAMREWLAPLLVGREICSSSELQDVMSPVKGNHFAKAGLDTAWWDLRARCDRIPLWRLIGGRTNLVDVGADIGVMHSVDALLDEMEKAVQAGFKRVKLKYRPGWEVDVIAAVRDRFPDTVVHVDCNSAYTLDDLSMLRELDQFDLAMVEQPLAHDDLVDHAALQGQIETPVCLDESIVSVEKARKAIELGACRWVNIKVGRTGGLTPAIAIHDLCHESGVPCWVGGMLESAVGQAHSAALATLPNMHYPADIFPSSRFYAPDLAEPPIELCAPSQVRASVAPGIGRSPNRARLERHLIQKATVG
jgi:O-succinylbenzoate synthase